MNMLSLNQAIVPGKDYDHVYFIQIIDSTNDSSSI